MYYSSADVLRKKRTMESYKPRNVSFYKMNTDIEFIIVVITLRARQQQLYNVE